MSDIAKNGKFSSRKLILKDIKKTSFCYILETAASVLFADSILISGVKLSTMI